MKHIKGTNNGASMANAYGVHSRIFNKLTIKGTYIQVMMGIKKTCLMFYSKKVNFFRDRKLSFISQTRTFEQ